VCSSVLGRHLYRRSGSAHHPRLLRLPHPDVLETSQGQAVQEGSQGRCRHEERSDAHQRYEGKGLKLTVKSEMEPGLRVSGSRVIGSAILAGPGRVTDQCIRLGV